MPFLVTCSDSPGSSTTDIPLRYAKQARLLYNLLEEQKSTGLDCDSDPEISISLPITLNVLEKALTYFEHYEKIPEAYITNEQQSQEYRCQIRPDNTIPIVDEWTLSFCKLDQQTLFELIKAANYLGATHLLDTLCASVARMLTGKTSEQIRTLFHIENDWSPEEEEKMREELQWLQN